MDAFAVSIASGLSVSRLRFRDAVKMAAFFGGFQAVMPLLGYLLGTTFAKQVTAYTHWIAFVLLLGLGIKMILESRGAADEKVDSPFKTHKLVVLAIATSIDAFAVGVTFSLLEMGLVATASVIGIVTFALCVPGVWFGAQLGKTFAKRAEILGGVVLIAIAIKTLLDHFW
jgi:putative Mn2+ efflux pump MntP